MKAKDLKQFIVGEFDFFNTPYGRRIITYADYIASGRTVSFIEKYIIDLERTYANPHTKDDYTGKISTDIYMKTKNRVRKLINATDQNSIIYVGTGATGAIDKMSKILGIYTAPATKNKFLTILNKWANGKEEKQNILEEQYNTLNESRPVVFITSYEHHSNELIWKEGFAEVVRIKLNEEGYFDIKDLENKLNDPKYKDRIKIGSFSAASNVTGILSPVYDMAKLMHKHNGYAFFDYAACAPYVEIDMNRSETEYFDGIYISPHKFLGGPGSPGLLVINNRVYNKYISPTTAGGGTVEYVNSDVYDFSPEIEEREDAGTPGLLQAIKLALAFELKYHFGTKRIEQIEYDFIKRGLNRLVKNPNIELLGPLDPKRKLSVVSFRIRFRDAYLHDQLITKLLNDLFGIQSRAGCLCAGPYVHILVGYGKQKSKMLRKYSLEGIGCLKPGVTRFNFHYTINEDEFNFLCDALEFIANYGYLFLSQYVINPHTGIWSHISELKRIVPDISFSSANQDFHEHCLPPKTYNKSALYKFYLKQANEIKDHLKKNNTIHYEKFKENLYGPLSWFYVVK